MLSSAWLFESSLVQPSVGLDIAQSVLRVLLASIASDEKQVRTTGTFLFPSHSPSPTPATNLVPPYPPPSPSLSPYPPSPLSFPLLLQYYVTATLKLQQLVHTPSLPKPELYFLLGHLSRIISEALDNGRDTTQYYVTVLITVYYSITLYITV